VFFTLRDRLCEVLQPTVIELSGERIQLLFEAGLQLRIDISAAGPEQHRQQQTH
jgi:hypothetical protein